MSPIRHPLVLASFVFLAGNTSHCNLTGPVPMPVGDFSHSVSTLLCGPADGISTGIMLARDQIEGLEPTNPYVRVRIDRPASEVGGRWAVGNPLRNVSAVYVTPEGRTEEATSGSVQIDRVVPQERVEGRVDLRFPSRDVTETFGAPWIEMFILCG